jgi:hypothetical protein
MQALAASPEKLISLPQMRPGKLPSTTARGSVLSISTSRRSTTTADYTGRELRERST